LFRAPVASTWVPSLQIRSTGVWSFAPPRRFDRRGLRRSPCLTDLLNAELVVRPARRLARQGLGRSPHLVDLLGRDLVGRHASQTCSVEIWSFVPSHGLARRGLGHTPRLADLLARHLVSKWARGRFMGLALGTRQLHTIKHFGFLIYNFL
jgi:hypothetical protein